MYGNYRKEQVLKHTPPEKIELAGAEKILNILNLSMILGTALFVAFIWGTLPEELPAQRSAYAQPSAYAGKASLLLLIGLMVFMFVIMTIIRRYPKFWNMPFHMTQVNVEKIYAVNADMISWAEFFIIGIFGYLCVMSALVGLDIAEGIGVWFPIILFTAIFIKIGVGIVKIFKAGVANEN